MRQRSIFWPLVLIGAGVVWLLVDLGKVPSTNLWALANLVPYLLLALGVGLILRVRWPIVYMAISALIVIGMLLAILFAPRLGWTNPPAWGWNWGGGGIQTGGSIPGSGVIVSQTRELPDFTAVTVNYPAEVVIRQGESTSVTVSADNNLQSQLATRVSNGVLYIENKEPIWAQRVNPSKPVQVTLTVKDLHDIEFPSAGSVRVVGLKTESLRISLSGAGDITLSGLNVPNLNLNMSGAGSIHADGVVTDLNADISGLGSFEGQTLAAQTVQVDISGAGSATLWVKERLTADISGVGSVNYYGSPQVQKNVSGLGSVNKVGDK